VSRGRAADFFRRLSRLTSSGTLSILGNERQKKIDSKRVIVRVCLWEKDGEGVGEGEGEGEGEEEEAGEGEGLRV
jgi:hypothetical protein